jgi:hypothetical protein
MDDVYKLFLVLGALAAVLVFIGITAVVAERRGRRKQRRAHQVRAAQAAAHSWKYQPTHDPDFRLSGRSSQGISWKLSAHTTDAENSSPEQTTWSTNSVFAPDVQLYVSKRSDYGRIGTWLGDAAAPGLKLFRQSAKEILVNAPAGGDDFIVVAADESIGYQVFGPETQRAYLNWLSTWERAKHWDGSFTIQLGDRNLNIEVNQFIDSIDVLQVLVELGEALAHSYRTIAYHAAPSDHSGER